MHVSVGRSVRRRCNPGNAVSHIVLVCALLLGLASSFAASTPASKPRQTANQAASVSTLHAGPVYTSSMPGENSSDPGPAYPFFDVVVSVVPQETSPAFSKADWQEAEPGRDTASAATEVEPFEKTGYGLSVILALDVSGSMRGRSMQTIRRSLGKFVDEAGTRDRVAVMTFADEARWDAPFTAQTAQVHQAIEAIVPRGRQTRLYDSLLSAIDHFEDSLPKRRVLIVISDGHDEGSSHTLDQVIAEANARHIAIQSIGVANSDRGYLQFLQSASDATGGTYAAARSDDELDHLLSQGIAALKQTPVVTFSTLRDDATPQTVPITITWLPKALKATADLTTGPITARRTNRTRMLASALIIGVALAGLVLHLLNGRRKKALPLNQGVAPAPPDSPAVRSASPPVPVAPSPVPSASPGKIDSRIPLHPGPLIAASPSSASPVSVGPRSPRHTRLAIEFRPDDKQAFAFLKAVDGPISGRTIAIDRSPFTIGAATDNLLAIAGDPTLSGHHACLSLERSLLFIDDLSSTNGTYINGVKLASARRSLAPGDELRLGRSLFQVLQSAAKE